VDANLGVGRARFELGGAPGAGGDTHLALEVSLRHPMKRGITRFIRY
jgi:hypothetical protein